jgi:hypothetical protein
VTGPRRVLIDADYAADGIWWVPSNEERESPISSYLTSEHLQPWPLSQGLLGDLQAWNQSWEDSDGFWDSAEARRAWQEQGRELAIRAQNEFGTDDWEVLYQLGDRVHRVHPPGSWPAETWEQDLLGYPSRERDMSVAAVVFTCQPKIAAAIDITTGPCVPEPGKQQSLVSVHRQQHGDRPEHLTALYQVLTDQPEAGAWAEVKRTGEAVLATFSSDYRSALASLRSGQQDPPGKLTEYAIRWVEATNWPSSLPARLSRNRLERMAGWATRATERQTPLYCWFGPAQPSPIS